MHTAEPDRLRAERDFYLRLIQLAEVADPPALLREALSLVVAATRARKAYVELEREGAAEPWWLAQGFDEAELVNVRAGISRGIIADAISGGRTLRSVSALNDPRFASHQSVQALRIEAVLCAPIGKLGVVYLQGRQPNGPFADEDQALVELFARHLVALAERLQLQARAEAALDHTVAVRTQIKTPNFIGRSRAMADVLRQVALVSPLDMTVLITGPSGTGKTAVARLIWLNSRRHPRPFIELNCATLPENLVESELFGAAQGAHSAASRKMTGKVEAADGGVLFLDEIAELPLSAQAKLLQLLQSKTYYALGSTRQATADVRIIAATSVDLKKAVAEKRFREDLYYRLHVVPLKMPALAERAEDVPVLATWFVEETCKQHQLQPLRLSAACAAALQAASWPGNVRELGHAIEAAVVRAQLDGGGLLETRHVFPEAPQRGQSPTSPPPELSFQAATRQFQSRLVGETLAAVDWNVSVAARRLDLTRSHLYNLIREFDLRRPGS